MNSTTVSVHDNPQQRHECRLRLQALLQRSQAVRFACLGTVDGRSWAFESHTEAADAARMSAFTSSLLALCEAFARDAIRSRCRYNVIAAEHGVIVTVRVPCSSERFALSVATGSDETVAMALRHALDAADDIASVLDSQAWITPDIPEIA